MRTFLQLLRISFWMLPLQRALTLIGALVLVGSQLFKLPLNWLPGSSLPITFLGVALMMVVPLLAGGVFLRMLSTSRALLLRPHARGRLLAGAVGILTLVTVFWVGCYWMAFRSAPPKYQPGGEQYLLMFATTLSFGTQCAIALFIASRSPLWTLLILAAWQLPGLLLHLFGVVDASRLLGGPVSLAMSGAVWAVFGTWYLRAQRIHASAWGRKDESTPVAAVAHGDVAPVSRDQALTRWVLGGSTPLRIGLQCLPAAVGVLALQWVLAGDSGERPLQAMMFGTLAGVAAAGGAISSAMAANARGLWLPGGRSRLQLHAWTEWRMVQVVLAICAAILLVGVSLWLVIPRAPLSPAYLFCELLLPGLAAAWLGLMQQHRRSLFDALAGLAILAGWFYGLVQPLYMGLAAARWDILAVQVGLTVLLREVAYVRWRSADWRRVQRA